MERVRMATAGDPEDVELDPPLTEDEPEDLQDDALVEDEADDQSESDEVDAKAPPPQPDQPQPSRGERRFQSLANELREERKAREAERTEFNRRIDAMLVGQRQAPIQQESPEARAQRLQLLTPEERIREELQTDRQVIAREMQQMRFANMDGNDRAAFQAKATVDPLYQRWSDKVEAELVSLRNQGMNVERERLMYYLIGKNAVENRSQQGKRQKAEAQRRVQRQQTRPANSGSDVAPRPTRSNSLERRLEDVQL